MSTSTVDVTPEGFGPSENVVIVKQEIERIRNETIDEAIARKVGYQIENGLVKLTEVPYYGWKATVPGFAGESTKVFSAVKMQDVLNQVFAYLYPDHAIPA